MIEILTHPTFINLVAFLFFWIALSRTTVFVKELCIEYRNIHLLITPTVAVSKVEWANHTIEKMALTSLFWAAFGFLISI